MHGPPWLRASEATRIRRRQINGLERLGAHGLGRLGRATGVLIGVLNGLGRPLYAPIGANNELRMHDYPPYPIEVFNRAAGVSLRKRDTGRFG
jgi:hypothetical protein